MIINTNKLPPHLVWRITHLCDYGECSFCYRPRSDIETDQQQALNIASKIIYYGANGVTISGGEPLFLDYTVNIIKHLKSKGIEVSLSTNGNLLLSKFPEYKDHLTVLALPLEGRREKDELIRGDGHYDRVIGILNDIRNSKETSGIKIKIETVITDKTTLEDLVHIRSICEEYDITLWKMFEYNRYIDNRNDSIDRIENRVRVFIQQNNGNKTAYESCTERSGRHFIINPNGDITIPELDNDKMFLDVNIGNIVESPKDVIEKWWRTFSFKDYYYHHNRIHSSIYREKDKYSDQDLLLAGVKSAGISRIYNGTSDFVKFRIYGEDEYTNIDEYLSLAKNKLIIICHNMENNTNRLIQFLHNKYDENPKFNFTIVLPTSGSQATNALASALSEGRETDFENKVQQLITDITILQTEIKKKYSEASFIVKYSHDVIFASTIVMDDKIFQIETKYLNIPGNKNLFLEFRKSINSDGYYQTLLDGVNGTISRATLDNDYVDLEVKKQFNDAIRVLVSIIMVIITIIMMIKYAIQIY